MSEYAEALVSNVSDELRDMFEGIAKLALQGASEANDPALDVIDKARKAHSRVTLIVDDAMRGLAKVNETMFVGMAFVAGSSDDDSTAASA
jgi:hypothetical protein